MVRGLVEMRLTILALALCAMTAGGSARSAETGASGDAAAPESGTATKSQPARKEPARAAAAPRRCRAAASGTACRAPRATIAAGPNVVPVEHPLAPPLGARVWRHEDPPLFDPYESAGPWHTGPWVHPGTNVVQWRYGFPGGHVDWFRGLGWRPGFGWF
jgi:hypothetical protein